MNDSGRMGMDKRKYFLLKTLIFLFMFVAALIALFPFYWMFVTAVKPVDEIFAFPPKLWPGEFIWSNFATALSRAPFGIYFRNSFIVTTLSTLITVCINLLAGFAFAKYKFKGKEFFFMIVLSTLMIPLQVTMIGFRYRIQTGYQKYTGALSSRLVQRHACSYQTVYQYSRWTAGSRKVDGARVSLPFLLKIVRYLRKAANQLCWSSLRLCGDGMMLQWPLIVLSMRNFIPYS